MALIKCPKCGKEKVSDSAESCPECGYNIKKHFDDIRKAEQEKKEAEKKKKEEEERIKKEKAEQEKMINCPECGESFLESLKICPYCGLSLDDKETLKKLSDIKYLEHEASTNDELLLWVTALIGSSILLFYFFFIFFSGDKGFFVVSMIILGILSFVGSLGCVIDELSRKKNMKNDAILAKADYDAYVLKKEKKLQELSDYIKRSSSSTKNVPKCPTCGSTKIRKISGTKRAASILGFGILSNNIGKTYECLNCKYKW